MSVICQLAHSMAYGGAKGGSKTASSKIVHIWIVNTASSAADWQIISGWCETPSKCNSFLLQQFLEIMHAWVSVFPATYPAFKIPHVFLDKFNHLKQNSIYLGGQSRSLSPALNKKTDTKNLHHRLFQFQNRLTRI